MRFVDLRADHELDFVALAEKLDHLPRRQRHVAGERRPRFEPLRHIGQRENALRHEVHSFESGRRRQRTGLQHQLHIDLDRALELARHDVGRRAAAENALAVEVLHQRSVSRVGLRTERRPGQQPQPPRLPQVDDHAADVVDAAVVLVAHSRGGDDRLRQIARRNIRALRNLLLDKGEAPLAPPAEFIAGLPEAGLRHTVRKRDEPVAGDRVKLGQLHPPVRPALGDHALALDLKILVVAQVDERRIVHLDNTGFPSDLKVENREGRVADLADLADRQRIHDDLGRLQDIHVGADELHRHRRGHRREQIRLDPAAEPVGEHGEVPVLRLEPLEQKIVAADLLPVVKELAALHFDKYIVRHLRLTS